MNREMQEIYDRVKAVAAGREDESAKIERRIEAQKKAIAEAQTAAADAFNKMDVDEYHKAQDKQRAAEDAVKMLEQHLGMIEDKKLMTQEEYKATETQIREVFDEEYRAVREKVAELVKDIAALYPGLSETWTAGQRSLELMQYDIMLDYFTTPKGNKVKLSGADKHLPEMSFTWDVSKMLESALAGGDPLQQFSK